MTIRTTRIDHLVKSTILIYSILNPHPIRKRPDCATTKHYKQECRKAMKKELESGGEELVVVAKYKAKMEQL